MMSNNTTPDNWPLFLSKMTSPEIVEGAKTAKIAILVVASIEEHGAHLPIDTDLANAEYLAVESLKLARQNTSQPVGYIAPSLPYGGPGIGMTWPGTIQLRPSVLVDVVCDLGQGLLDAGFQYIIIINGCYGNTPALMLATSQLKEKHPEGNFILTGGFSPEALRGVRESAIGGTGHACEIETSMALAINPEYVQMDKAVKEEYRHPSPGYSLDFDSFPPFFWPVSFNEATESGVIGDATLGTVEKGKKILEGITQHLSGILVHIHELAQQDSEGPVQ